MTLFLIGSSLALPTGLSGQEDLSSELARLRAEVARLNAQIATLEAAPTQDESAVPRTVEPTERTELEMPAETTATRTTQAGQEIVVLSPYEVSTEKDFGYLATNSVTASRIGMEIQDIPLAISVVSREFIEDTNARDVMDLFRYAPATSGDTRYKMRVPANERTAQGVFTMRGFQVKSILRNGVFRYVSNNFDNVERVEMVRGPASVFFGQSYPGGVINFITKRPQFADIPTELSWQLNSNGGNRITFDHNQMVNDQIAVRFVGGWEDTEGERDFEYNKMFTFNPSITINPFESGKLRVILEVEHSQVQYNRNDYAWIFSDRAGWKAAAANGPFLSNTIPANAGNGLAAPVVQMTTTPTLAYATYMTNKNLADITLPTYTNVERGAYYTDASGNEVYDEDFNFTSRGAYSKEDNNVITATLDASPFDWLDGRYVFTKDAAQHNSVGQGGALMLPWADGIHWDSRTGNLSGYWRDTEQHNVDLVFKADFWGMENKLLTGYQKIDWLQQYLGNSTNSDVNWAFLPGARNPESNPDYAGTNRGKYDLGNVPVNQVIYDRNGNIKPVRQIYSNYDPGVEIAPDVNQFFNRDRNALDGYAPTQDAYYVNLQSTMLDDRLTLLAGYREEHWKEYVQVQANNFPWYVYPTDEFMWMDPVKYPENQWGHSINYQKTIPRDDTGDSWMIGASYAINDQVSVYAQTSQIFNFNTGIIGGHFTGDEQLVANGIIAEMQAQGLSSITYRGRQISTAQGFMDIWVDELQYNSKIPNEEGMNYEFGAKLSTEDQKLVGTISFFRMNRKNLKLDDGAAQANNIEEVNFSPNPIFIGGLRRAVDNGAAYTRPADSATSTGRIFRVYTYGNNQQVEGFDGEVIWSPTPNFQAVFNASWIWQAGIIEDTRAILAEPGTPGYDLLSDAQKVQSYISWNSRLVNVPELTAKFFGKYTFTEGIGGFGQGAYVGLGVRYSSETVISQSVAWNPLNGGFQAGNYVIVDVTAGIPWELFGTRIRTSIGLYNATDETYFEGSFVPGPARNWLLTNAFFF